MTGFVPGRRVTPAEREAAMARLRTANLIRGAAETERLIAALKKGLATADGPPKGDSIPTIAWRVKHMARGERHFPSPAAADEAIASVVSALRKLESLSWTKEDPPAPLPLPLPLLFRFATVAGEAAALARDIEAAAPPTAAPGKRGRRRVTAARAIAEFLRQETERLTGQSPGRSVVPDAEDKARRERGKFMTPVREVFEVLEVRTSTKTLASPEQAARAAIEAASRLAGPRACRRRRRTEPMGSNQRTKPI